LRSLGHFRREIELIGLFARGRRRQFHFDFSADMMEAARHLQRNHFIRYTVDTSSAAAWN
jgi:hypothetical protein